MTTIYLRIGEHRYYCPRCGIEWLTDELENLGDIGCSGCGRKFDIEEEEDLYEHKVKIRKHVKNNLQTD